jgi:hypothetical protein
MQSTDARPRFGNSPALTVKPRPIKRHLQRLRMRLKCRSTGTRQGVIAGQQRSRDSRIDREDK